SRTRKAQTESNGQEKRSAGRFRHSFTLTLLRFCEYFKELKSDQVAKKGSEQEFDGTRILSRIPEKAEFGSGFSHGGHLPKINIARSKQSCMEVLISLVRFVALGASVGSLSAVAGDVHALFNLADPAIGPFPSDQFTVP